MEQLEGKYFENTIAALKKARLQEDIQISSVFQSKLRSGLVEKISLLSVSKKPDWSDFVLRNKYIWGGVPVLAVLTIVAINALNFQVKMPDSTNFLTITDRPQDSSSAYKSTANSEFVVEDTGIKTFSADLVMPPAEYLQKTSTDRNAGNFPDHASDGLITTNQAPFGYVFLEGDNSNVKITTPVTTVPAAKLDDKQRVVGNPVLETIYNDLSVQQTTPIQNLNKILMSPEEAARQEQNAKVQEADNVTPVPVIEASTASKTDVEQMKTAVSETTPVQPAENVVGFSEVDSMQTPTVSDQQELTVTPSPLPEVRVQSIQYINPVEELNQPVAKTTEIQYSQNLNMIMSQYLTGDRIIYTGSDRAAVVQAILAGFSSRNGNLSSDYRIEVKIIEDGSFKATLFEYGKVKKMIILAERDGQLVVVTELDY